MKKIIEVEVCDFCSNEEIEGKCQICSRSFCCNHMLSEDWRFIDTSLCNKCGDKVWDEFSELIKRLKEEYKNANK